MERYFLLLEDSEKVEILDSTRAKSYEEAYETFISKGWEKGFVMSEDDWNDELALYYFENSL